MKQLFRLLVLAAIGFGIYRAATEAKSWAGLNETEMRTKLGDKLNSKLATKVPDEKIEAICDQVVAKMIEAGFVQAD